jgi:2-methylcitrate dehydratase
MDGNTRLLVDYAQRLTYADIPSGAIHAAKVRLIDTIACLVGAYDNPLCVSMRNIAARYEGAPAARIVGSPKKTTAEMAAFANGVMLRYLDMSDMYRVKNSGHPSDLFAPILAVAEAVDADGQAALTAITLAYDVYCAFSETLAIKPKGWDQPVYGVVASALGAGKLLGLDREQMAQAIALALAPNMALVQTRRGELSNWKNCAGANASRNGIFAALLAKEGVTGPSAVFEGEGGLYDIVGKFVWDPSVTKTNLKSFPVCYHGQAAAWATLDARNRLSTTDIGAIEEVSVEAYLPAIDEMAHDPTRWAPTTPETADHSLPFAVAVVLKDGDLTPESYSQEYLTSAALRRLMSKVKCAENPDFSARYPKHAPCRITVKLASGESVVGEVDAPQGHSSHPMDDAQVQKKFRAMFRGYGPKDQAEQVLEAAWSFERGKVSRILDLLLKQS